MDGQKFAEQARPHGRTFPQLKRPIAEGPHLFYSFNDSGTTTKVRKKAIVDTIVKPKGMALVDPLEVPVDAAGALLGVEAVPLEVPVPLELVHAPEVGQVFEPPWPALLLAHPWVVQVAVAKFPQAQPAQFLGNPDATDKLLTVGTAAA
jgi:hypothetical protein